ncbi:MAG TPA: LamG domain-containing protein, partial [Nocardioides sp.]|nr:LamG domain-containing protein [Nocardioides sp.]
MRLMRRLAAALVALSMPTLAVVALDADPAAAYWSATSAPGGRGAAAATSVNAGATPTTSVTGANVTVSWSASTLADGAAVTGYQLSRYDAATLTEQTVLASCAGTITATTCIETGVPEGSWRYAVTPLIGAHWQGAESAKSTTALVDTTAPTSALSLSSVTGAATLSGNTLIYRGSSAGSFRITNTVTDAVSGPASSATAALTGTTTGWTHTGSTVTTPAGGPYVSNVFSWAAGTTSNPSEVVTTKDAKGNTRTTTLNFLNDVTAPGGTITYADGYSSGRSVAVSYTTSGDAATAQLQRSRASLKNGVCGTFGAFTNIGPVNAASPYSDGPLTSGACYKYQLVVSDLVGNSTTATSANVAKLGYAGAVQATTGLLSYWRLGESAATASDSFTGTAGVALQDRDGETGATWTRHPSATADAVLTAGGRLRKEDTSALAIYLASGVPLTANYRVEATVVAQSVVANDQACVLGRLDASAATGYAACYDQNSGSWTLLSVVSGTSTTLGAFAQSFPAGSSRRVGLDLAGTTIRVLVDGVAVISATSSSITAAGRGGLMLGPTTGTTTQTDATGLQLDDFRIGPVDAVPPAADSKGSNAATYVNGPTLGQAGVLAGDSDTSARFDGVDDYVQDATPTGFPTGSSARSIELWFKTSGTGRQVLFGYGNRATSQEFALWINAGGTSMTSWGFGSGQDKTFTLAAAVNDGQWHQAALTFGSGTMSLYVDGALVGTQTATRATTIDAYGFGLGAIIVPGDSNSGGYFNGWLDEVSLYTT